MANVFVRYTAFACIATVSNLLAQRFALALLTGAFAFPLAIGVGTGVGLVVKYLLDRKWVFQQTKTLTPKSAWEFARYTATGVITTCLFWGTESGAWLIFKTDVARELGAILGLGVGYVVKYQLDKRYVFNSNP